MKYPPWKQRLFDRYISSEQTAIQSYDPASAFAKELPYLRYVIRRFVPADRNSRIIDLGCGRGGFVYLLREMGYRHVKGYDLSQEQLEYAWRIGLQGAVAAGDCLEVAAALPPASVDVFILFDVLEHLRREDLFLLLEHALRALKPAGRMIVHVPNAHGIFGNSIRYGDLTHETAFTVDSLRQLFRAAGFAEVVCYEDKPLLFSIKSVVRRLIWELMTLQFRLINLAETGSWTTILSRNLLAVARTKNQ